MLDCVGLFIHSSLCFTVCNCDFHGLSTKLPNNKLPVVCFLFNFTVTV